MSESTNRPNEKEDRRLITEETSEECVVSPTVGTYTFEEALEAVGMGRYQIFLLLYVGFAWVCDAMEMMLLSFLAPAADCEWGLSSVQKGAITSVVFVGMFVGAYSWGALADSEGRKIGFLAPAIFTAFWGFASALAPNYPALLVFRSLVGLGIGGLTVAFSLFLEFVPTGSRGRYAILLQGFWTVGALSEAGLAWLVLPSLGWRYLLGISTIPFAILLLFYPLLSESPRFLAMKGKTLKAERILAKVAQWNRTSLPNGKLSTPSPNVRAERKGPKYHIKKVASGMVSGLEELLSSTLRRRTLLLFVIWFVHAMMYYGLVLLTTELQSKDSGECSADGDLELDSSDYLEIFIDTAAETVGFLLSFLMIDRIGRKKTMMGLLTICGMALWPLVLSSNDTYQTAMLFASRAAVTGSFNALFVYTPELFPTDVRAFGLGICNAWSRFGGLVAPFFAVHLVDEGHETVVELFFAVLCFVAVLATGAIPIETMGRELQDVVEVEMVPQREGTQLPSDEEIEPL